MSKTRWRADNSAYHRVDTLENKRDAPTTNDFRNRSWECFRSHPLLSGRHPAKTTASNLMFQRNVEVRSVLEVRDDVTAFGGNKTDHRFVADVLAEESHRAIAHQDLSTARVERVKSS